MISEKRKQTIKLIVAVTILVLSDKSQNIKQTIRKETSVGVLNSLIIGFLGFLMAIGILMLFFSENGVGYSLKIGRAHV